MSLKARFRIAIVALASLIVVAMSALYVRGFLRASFESTDQIAKSLAENIERAVAFDLNEVHRPSTMEESKKAWLEAIQHDESIRDTLARATGAWPQIGEIDLTDSDGRIRASSRDEMIGRQHVPVPLFETWKGMSLLSNVRRVFFRPEDTELVRALGVAGEPLFQVHIVLSSVLLRNLLLPELQRLGTLSMIALLASIAVALALPSLIMNPLERLTARIDRMATVPGTPPVTPVREG